MAVNVWVLAACVTAVAAVHYPDNGDGTYSNPVMPNGHWSDPSIVRVGTSYYIVTSSIETTPQMQILESHDLVNWDVIGSVLRFWPDEDPVTGRRLSKQQCWSPRLMHINGKFRVMWHSSGSFLVAEATAPTGPWTLIKHNLTEMGLPSSSPQWAATTFIDPTTDKTYVFAANWIQQCDTAALNWVGPRRAVADMTANGVGLMENPSLMRRGEWYYWHESSNGTVTWGLSPDPNGGASSSNKGLLSVWRARALAGPWEGPRHVIKSNVDFTCVNTGTVVLGPDNRSWYYVYNAIEARRWSLQRQLFLDKLEWNESTGWPVTMTPSRTRPVPTPRSEANPSHAPPPTPRWTPELSDEFDGPGLEGVTMGVLGRKWLFKQEDPALWSLTDRRGTLTLNATCTGIDSAQPANLLLQRPTSAYFSLETHVEWVGVCGSKGKAPLGKQAPAEAPAGSGHAGIIVRELNSGSGAAVGLKCDPQSGLRVVFWQDTLNEGWVSPFTLNTSAVHLKLDVDLVKTQAWWSDTGSFGSWSALVGEGDREQGFTYTSTRLAWELVHTAPNGTLPSRGAPGGDGGEGGARTTANSWTQADSFTTLHPGLFAGGSTSGNAARFDYWRYTDHEVFAD